MSDSPLADAIEAVLLDVRAHYKHHPSARTEAHALAYAIADRGALAHVLGDVDPEALGFEAAVGYETQTFGSYCQGCPVEVTVEFADHERADPVLPHDEVKELFRRVQRDDPTDPQETT